MLREALSPNRGRVASGRPRMVPAPVAGLNLRDSIASMKPEDALVLDNIFPEATYCRIRRGFVEWTTGLPATPETLMEWSGAGRQFFAACGSDIYNISAGGPVGPPLRTDFTNGRWQHLMFSNTGGNYIVAVNGADGVLTYDGTTWTAQTITGATAAGFVQVASWKRRLWFAENDTSSAWYLGTDAISGAASELNLGGVWRNGGTLARIISTSYDTNSTGAQDFIGFLSSNGELAMYQGTDPASPSTFGLAGVFQMGVPIGDRSSYQSGGDTVVITNDGVLSMLEMMRVGDRASAPRASITDRIALAVSNDVRDYKLNFGWQIVGYPAGHMAILNVPTSATTARQWVLNTVTGGWCRFTGHNAACWGLYDNNLYFGAQSGGIVYRADEGFSDDGAVIPWALKGSFQPFGGVGDLKKFTMIQPIVRTNGGAAFGVGVDVDYGDALPNSVFNSEVNAALWDVDLWDVGIRGGMEMVQDWISLLGIGRVAAVMMRGSTIGIEAEINAFHLIAEPARGPAL